MATVQITTWDEFKTALTATITENTTYEIMNDIDVSGEILTSQIRLSSGTNYFNKTFNGGNHTINGLTTYANINLFYLYNTYTVYTFNQLHFSNFMLSSATFLYQDPGTDYAQPCRFNDCLFNGICSVMFAGTGRSNRYSILTRCSFNVRCNSFITLPGVYIRFNDCYIIINPLAEYNHFVYTNYGSLTNSANNYIGGTIHKQTYTTSSSDYMIYGIGECGGNNVFNCDVYIHNYSATTTYYISNSDGSAICLFNKSKIMDSTGNPVALVGDRTNCKGLTDTQMKSRTYIQENTNFPLYS